MANIKAQRKEITNADGSVAGTAVVYPNMVKAARKQNRSGFTYFKRGFICGALVGSLAVGSIGFFAYNHMTKDAAGVTFEFPTEPPVMVTEASELSRLLAQTEDIMALVPVKYKIKPGDSLWSIASRLYNTGPQKQAFVDQVVRDNGIKDKDNIVVGDTLRFYVPEDQLGNLNMGESYTSPEEEYLHLKSYIEANESCIENLAPSEENQAIYKDYKQLAERSNVLEARYEKAKSNEDRQTIITELVSIARMRADTVEQVSKLAFVPMVDEVQGAVKTR